ncbi:MAG: hypothetical protein COU90_01155 [Candidatus Ryanbacteria bacterium CG10_big_fil_rev_8_21_14_0_10_43_42]|uniref:Uncharacterized protein n=1 Tax=Candidatus Ryanbacteria bacterium CG10_big_fil_rev_8_21_14_0_10_43_42 TaxID=1974864 RepID=A0A2M8KY41_9BACT|nr:MAG: hypothetical protein COU90_01155 [Candidatus Ryanbacteria bacterium CG10_big_fil_rev_8_21_14_0_10_43_42]
MGENNQSENVRQENHRTEYNIVATTWRFFVSLRFIVAAFAVTLHSALLTLYSQFYQQQTVLSQISILGLPSVGTIAALAIFLIELRNIDLYILMIQRGRELEDVLDLQDAHFARLGEPYTRPLTVYDRLISHTMGIYILHVGVATLWVHLFVLSIWTLSKNTVT